MDTLDRDCYIDEVTQGAKTYRDNRPEEDPTSDYTSLRIPPYKRLKRVELFYRQSCRGRMTNITGLTWTGEIEGIGLRPWHGAISSQ